MSQRLLWSMTSQWKTKGAMLHTQPGYAETAAIGLDPPLAVAVAEKPEGDPLLADVEDMNVGVSGVSLMKVMRAM